jgi:hypothetical protein
VFTTYMAALRPHILASPVIPALMKGAIVGPAASAATDSSAFTTTMAAPLPHTLVSPARTASKKVTFAFRTATQTAIQTASAATDSFVNFSYTLSLSNTRACPALDSGTAAPMAGLAAAMDLRAYPTTTMMVRTSCFAWTPALEKGAIARGAAAAAKNSRVCPFLAHKLVNAALNKGEIA